MSSLAWLYSKEVPLPSGLRIEEVSNSIDELNQERKAGMAALLGERAAHSLMSKLGRYELDEEKSRDLGLAGVALGEGGEFPALSPERWAGKEKVERWEAMQLRLQEGGGKPVGICLDSAQRESFLKFLARNRVGENRECSPAEIIAIARHFFFDETIQVVVTYSRALS